MMRLLLLLLLLLDDLEESLCGTCGRHTWQSQNFFLLRPSNQVSHASSPSTEKAELSSSPEAVVLRPGVV